MPSIQIRVRLGKLSKSFTGNKRLISVGRAKTSDLVLPFPFLHENHLEIENTSRSIRVRVGDSSAQATAEGKSLGTDWVKLPSPGHVEIPTADGKKMLLDLMSAEPRLGALILRDMEGNPNSYNLDESSVQILSNSRFQSNNPAGDGFSSSTDATGGGEADWKAMVPWWGSRRIVIPIVSLAYLFLIVGALIFNRVRSASDARLLAEETQLVSSKIEEANNEIRSGHYASAKAALDAAAPVAARVPQLAGSVDEIARIRARPEIQFGAAGYVLVGDQWLPEQTARDIKAAREIDDPKIANLERKATEGLAAAKYEDARTACEQALAIMKAEATQPHPRDAAVRALLQNIKNQSITADMTAKGYALYEGRWIKADEKFKLEQQGKGLVLYDGQWITREQAAEVQSKTAAGLVIYQGKWMTPDQKMEAQGLVKVDGKWITPQERDAQAAQRRLEEEQHKAEMAKVEQVRKGAYVKSQDIIRQKMNLPKSTTFQEFGSDKVTVVEDQGWFIVQGTVTYVVGSSTKPITKVYYCKLRPKPGSPNEWESDAVSFAE